MIEIAGRETRPSYARASDFCRIFEREMNALYSLAFLLTADTAAAEKTFVNALQQCLADANVFSGWERAWSRRAIVKQAIQIVRPVPDDSAAEFYGSPGADDGPGRRLIRLRSFERFVFAMTVLERYTVPECAAFLSCRVGDVEAARIRSLQIIGGADLTPHMTNGHAPGLPTTNAVTV